MKKIVFCGGGSAGHIMPNINIIKSLLNDNIYDIYYIGSGSKMELQIINSIPIKYLSISSGKLRRYFDINNFIDVFKILYGIIQSYKLLKKIKPFVVFSKGGYVSVPVVISAYLLHIPVITHESDLTLGLANKIILKFAKIICLAFSSAKSNIPSKIEELNEKDINNNFDVVKNKIKSNKKFFIVTGIPIHIYQSNITKEEFCAKYNFDINKKILFFFGGSLGASFINDFVIKNQILLSGYNIIHQCGNIDYEKLKSQIKHQNYHLVSFVDTFTMSQFYTHCDIVISRSGATTLFEILSYKKKSILIPLPLKGSRGDQIHNGQLLDNMGLAKVILQEKFNNDLFFATLNNLIKDNKIQQNLDNFVVKNDIEIYKKLFKLFE